MTGKAFINGKIYAVNKKQPMWFRSPRRRRYNLYEPEALRGVGATIPASPLPAFRLYGLTGRRGGIAQSLFS